MGDEGFARTGSRWSRLSFVVGGVGDEPVVQRDVGEKAEGPGNASLEVRRVCLLGYRFFSSIGRFIGGILGLAFFFGIIHRWSGQIQEGELIPGILEDQQE